MVTLRHTVYDKFYLEIRCNHNETKPTANIPEGSVLIEVDTGNIYFFNNGAWVAFGED